MRRHLLNGACLSVGKIGSSGFEKCLSIHFQIPLKGRVLRMPMVVGAFGCGIDA